MIGYRFLLPAEEEMTEASDFTKLHRPLWGWIFRTTSSVGLICFACIQPSGNRLRVD